MEIKQLIQAGKLVEAREQLVAAVKVSPADMASRSLLFQVLCYNGEWEKADRHLQAIAAQDAKRGAGALGYRNIIQAEINRREVASDKHLASFISEPPDYFDLFVRMRKSLAAQNETETTNALKDLDSRRPQLSGTVNGDPFVGFCDTDTTLFPFLEVIAHERYLWVPFESIRELIVSAPESLLDLLWISASITTWEGLTMNCYLPVVYPNTFDHDDVRIKMGRMTDWQPLAGTYARGVGQHVFEVGGKDMAILELREVLFNFSGKEKNDDKND